MNLVFTGAAEARYPQYSVDVTYVSAFFVAERRD